MTDPIDSSALSTAPRIVVAATYKDPQTGALYVHQDLQAVMQPWEAEDHISFTKATESFGDVESWVAYVTEHSGAPDFPPFLTWNEQGLKAVLDYHTAETPGRCQWVALCPFRPSQQWLAWLAFADGRPHTQKDAIEHLEDLAPDVVDPPLTGLAALLRNLRATANATATTELRPDGTASVQFASDKQLRTAGDVELPSELAIEIPVLRGHVDAEGRPIIYRLAVRLRADVDNAAHLSLRFSIPLAERVREAVFADRVKATQVLLGDGYSVLRAA